MRLYLIVAAVSLGGCVGAGEKPIEALDNTVRGYNEGLRWERFELAAAALPPLERATRIDEWDQRAKDLKISDYEVVKMDQRGDKAKVQVKVTWYLSSEGTVHETQSVEYWERHAKQWQLVDEKRLRGTEMPGLAEPLKKPADGAAGAVGSGSAATAADASATATDGALVDRSR